MLCACSRRVRKYGPYFHSSLIRLFIGNNNVWIKKVLLYKECFVLNSPDISVFNTDLKHQSWWTYGVKNYTSTASPSWELDKSPHYLLWDLNDLHIYSRKLIWTQNMWSLKYKQTVKCITHVPSDHWPAGIHSVSRNLGVNTHSWLSRKKPNSHVSVEWSC